ncbi:fibrinogen-like protein 1-like protein [Tubulanus polymorphus]|uniref:fibrinogen-like protein 1-like protein n=1 Tax=Tubulanus polymorphus TaxID=672921 RepID=UPI003DA24743
MATCTGFGYGETVCILGNRQMNNQNCSELITAPAFVYYEEAPPGFCLNGGRYVAKKRLCINCSPGWTGQRCEKLAQGCEDYCNAHVRSDGSYWQYIRPGGAADSLVFVRCTCYIRSMGCTMLSKRTFNDSDNFNKSWAEYKDGFNTSGDSMWLGLETLHKLVTNGRAYTLCVELHAKTNHSISKKIFYDNLLVEDESNNYRISLNQSALDVSDLRFKNWGDALFAGGENTSIYNMYFSTYDRDNDQSPESNCASDYGGGWWFNNCTSANLNGFWPLMPGQPQTALKTWNTVAKKWGGPAIGFTKLYVCATK